VGPDDPEVGPPTQMAVFTRTDKAETDKTKTDKTKTDKTASKSKTEAEKEAKAA
jgi:hypothetical protein